MSDNTMDVRGKVSADVHAALAAIAQVNNEEIAEIVRRLVQKFVADEVHKANVLTRLMQGKGTVGSARE